jgi:hypothetical protein
MPQENARSVPAGTLAANDVLRVTSDLATQFLTESQSVPAGTLVEISRQIKLLNQFNVAI